MVALEAMSPKRTVVAFAVGGLREIIEHIKHGVSVETEKPSAIACVELMDDLTRLHKIGAAGAECMTLVFPIGTQRVFWLVHHQTITSLDSPAQRPVAGS